jgi:hypothetical protein
MKRVLRIVAALLAIITAGSAAFVVLTPAGTLIWAATKTAIFAPPPPPLLEHVTGASGWFGGCPPRNEQEAAGRAAMGEALSPELNQKLAAQFPPGSSADSLVRTLSEQGFKLAEACQNDSTIRRAWFQGPMRGAIFETRAEIYWRTEGDALVWTKGFVMFIGL